MIMDKPINCIYCDNDGFCRVYSNSDVAWKCSGNGDCEKFKED